MNIIFLDIDGVLNSMPYFESIRGHKNVHNEIDESKLPYLQRIVKENNAQIVLSSTWRELDDKDPGATRMWGYLIDTLNKYDLSIMSKTPFIDNIRPLEIKTWLDNRPDKDDIDWISIEDDCGEKMYEEYGVGGHLIETNFFTDDIDDGGLQEKHVELARQLFQKGEKYD